uniref:Uncharacterized protein n=1 Tax=Rousettus aegyptiacus TaxID=9407 RepID=A0A7J8DHM0_ROUAE|nr:hypothetical protein HJG63_008510 [Rousettus aegyptiacus]
MPSLLLLICQDLVTAVSSAELSLMPARAESGFFFSEITSQQILHLLFGDQHPEMTHVGFSLCGCELAGAAGRTQLPLARGLPNQPTGCCFITAGADGSPQVGESISVFLQQRETPVPGGPGPAAAVTHQLGLGSRNVWKHSARSGVGRFEGAISGFQGTDLLKHPGECSTASLNIVLCLNHEFSSLLES